MRTAQKYLKEAQAELSKFQLHEIDQSLGLFIPESE